VRHEVRYVLVWWISWNCRWIKLTKASHICRVRQWILPCMSLWYIVVPNAAYRYVHVWDRQFAVRQTHCQVQDRNFYGTSGLLSEAVNWEVWIKVASSADNHVKLIAVQISRIDSSHWMDFVVKHKVEETSYTLASPCSDFAIFSLQVSVLMFSRYASVTEMITRKSIRR
jgi:hypothetical protein